MSDELEIDILAELENTDLSDVSTERPLLPQGNYVLRVIKVAIEENNKKTGHNVNIELETTAPAESEADHRGNTQTIQPGWKVYNTLSLVATPKYSKERILQSLAAFQEAALHEKESGFMYNVNSGLFIGAELTASLNIERSDKWGDKNRVNRYLK